jgi:hypothetical protein
VQVAAYGFAVIVAVATSTPDAGAPARPPPLLAPVIGGGIRRETPAPRYELRPVPGGGYEFDDPRFSAQVARDGRVTFSDHHLSRGLRLIPFIPEPHPPGTQTLEGTVRKLLGERPRNVDPPPAPEPKVDPVASPELPKTEAERKWRAEYPYLTVAMANSTLDLTDEYYRMLGEDPYRREKARFLAATFDMRLKLAARAEAAELRSEVANLSDRLAQIWADRTQPPAARRRVVCALWAELARDGKGAGAGHVITTFVRTRLAAGTADAYPRAELAACSKSGGLAFAPYDLPTPVSLPKGADAGTSP